MQIHSFYLYSKILVINPLTEKTESSITTFCWQIQAPTNSYHTFSYIIPRP